MQPWRLSRSFFRSVLGSLVRLFVCWLVRSFVLSLAPFVRSLVQSSIRSLVCSFHVSTRSFVQSSALSLGPAVERLGARSFICSFVSSSIWQSGQLSLSSFGRSYNGRFFLSSVRSFIDFLLPVIGMENSCGGPNVPRMCHLVWINPYRAQ